MLRPPDIPYYSPCRVTVALVYLTCCREVGYWQTSYERLRAYLSEHGVGTDVYYPLPLHLQPCFAALGYRQGDFPAAERAAEESLALPMYPELSEAQQVYIVTQIADFYHQLP